MRGDGPPGPPRMVYLTGSPPHAWGRRRRRREVAAQARFTPTCVGTAIAPCPFSPFSTVHPHMRGDGAIWSIVAWSAVGSPPHAWGRRASASQSVPHPSVHPHMRGDGSAEIEILTRSLGSPPHAWGRPQGCDERDASTRFTPTCVGTATSEGVINNVRTVHPHMRGDGIDGQVIDVVATGSPPHAWGRLFRLMGSGDRERFTPTCVGTAPTLDSRARRSTVHPHMRGDGVSRLRVAGEAHGSPPHAWGRHWYWVYVT